MATNTEFLNLKKPTQDDFYNVQDFNDNADLIDAQLKSHDDSLKLQSENLDDHESDEGNPHKVTAEQVGLGNVENLAINDQRPTYTESSTLTTLETGEKVSVAFGKIKKAITSLISHIADTTKHITSTERTTWNGKFDKTGGTVSGYLGVYKESTPAIEFNAVQSTAQIIKNASATVEDGLLMTDFANSNDPLAKLILRVCHKAAKNSLNDALGITLVENGTGTFYRIFGEHNASALGVQKFDLLKSISIAHDGTSSGAYTISPVQITGVNWEDYQYIRLEFVGSIQTANASTTNGGYGLGVSPLSTANAALPNGSGDLYNIIYGGSTLAADTAYNVDTKLDYVRIKKIVHYANSTQVYTDTQYFTCQHSYASNLKLLAKNGESVKGSGSGVVTFANYYYARGVAKVNGTLNIYGIK